jgi:hypothetical protein
LKPEGLGGFASVKFWFSFILDYSRDSFEKFMSKISTIVEAIAFLSTFNCFLFFVFSGEEFYGGAT